MAEALQIETDAFLGAREAARAQFNASIAAALARKKQALEAYVGACRVADVDPANSTTWSAAAAARVTYLAALDQVNAAITAAAIARDAAITAAAQNLCMTVPPKK